MAKKKKDALEYLDSEYKNLNQESPEYLDYLKGSNIADITMGSTKKRTYSVADLGLDYLPKYEDYLDLDKINVISQDVNKLRAESQSGWEQGFNAVAGGIASGLATAVEDMSYVLDFDNHIKTLQGVDTWEKNAIAEAMGQFKESIDEAMPIYKESSDTFDWDDPAFYWSSLKGIIDSAVGFGLPGGVIAKGVSGLTKATRIAKLTELLSKGSATAVRGVDALGAGWINNYAEGKIMGVETFENTQKELQQLVADGKLELSPEDIDKVAGEAANKMLLYNRAFFLTDAFGVHGLMKGVGTTRNILKQRGFKNRFKDFGNSIVSLNSDNLLLQGGKEALEEMGQNAIQMESEYQAKKEAGIDVSNYDEDAITRISGFLTSDQALLEGMMGFFGGGPQRILSELSSGRYTKAGKEAYDKAYAEQQAAIGEAATFLEGTSQEAIKMMQDRDAYLKKGKKELAEAVEDGVFASTAIRQFINGTTEEFEQSLKDMAEGNISEEQKQLWGDNYQETANRLLGELSKLESVFIKNSHRPNVAEVVANYSKYESAKKVVAAAEKYQNDIIKDLDEEVQTILESDTGKYLKYDKEGNTISYDIASIDKNPYDKKTDEAAYNTYEKFLNEVKNLENFKTYTNVRDRLKVLKNAKKKNLDAYNNSKTGKAAEDYLKRREEVQENTNNAINEAATETEVPVTEIAKDKKYKDNTNTEWIVSDILPDGRIKVRKATNNKMTSLLTPEQFDAKFKNQAGEVTAKVNATEAKNTKKKESIKENNTEVKSKSPEEQTTEEKKVAKAPGDSKGVFNIEPSNENPKGQDDAVSKIEDLEVNKSKNPNALAWLSVNNPRNKGGGSLTLTNYLEQKNKNIVGKKVSISIGTPFVPQGKEKEDFTKEYELFDKFNNRENLSEEETNSLVEDLIENGTIAVTVLREDGSPIIVDDSKIEMFLHLPSYIKDTDPDSKKYKEAIRQLRGDIVLKLMDNNSLEATITDKANGSIQNTSEYVPVTSILLDVPYKDISLSIRHTAGNFSTGSDEKGNVLFDEELDVFTDGSAPRGAVFVKVKTANGTVFPMRLKVDTVNREEAELLYNVYLKIISGINPGVALSNEAVSDILEQIKNSENPRISELLKLLPNKEESRLNDIINALVYENEPADGNSENPVLYPLYSKNKVVHYGKKPNGKTNFFAASNAEQYKEDFINWLMTNKLRNINLKQLNTPEYKKYLLDNNLLKSNAKVGTEGPVFAQPTLTISQPTIKVSEPMGAVMTAADIEAVKKADIERKRQEELENPVSEGKLQKVAGQVTAGSLKLTNVEITWSKNAEGTPTVNVSRVGQNVLNLVEQKTFDTSEEARDYANDYIKKRKVLYEEAKELINAKYDAELAALEKTTKVTTEEIDREGDAMTAAILGITPTKVEEKEEVDEALIEKTSIKISNKDLENFVTELINSKEYAEEDINNNIPSLLETFNFNVTELSMSPIDALHSAKNQFIEILNNCK